MTRLRKMMLEELQRRNYSAITTRNYLRVGSHQIIDDGFVRDILSSYPSKS